MSAPTLPACLIAQPVQFEAPAGFPPSIESAPAAMLPIDDIVRIQLDDDVREHEFEVVVRDPDVDERLEFLVYVDYNSESPRIADASGAIPVVSAAPGVDRTRRTLSFTLQEAGTLLGTANRCHRIELRVSRGFRGQTPEPDVAGDLGTAVWWAATREDESQRVEMVSCP